MKMSLQAKVMEEMKAAMKAKNSVALESLRAIKSAILLAKTDKGAEGELSEEDEIKLVQKLVKQRKDSAAIFQEQGRADLAEPELAQIAVIEKFLPEQLTEEEIEKVVVQTIDALGVTGMQDMGKVMGIVSKELAGQADGKTISTIVKQKLS
ncbi:aspartyl-tRNA amidotransferase subunit B [Croceivirga lutea]|nr:aspartyl-tRNA amidotransferase subunit B [Croceivirga lutea]